MLVGFLMMQQVKGIDWDDLEIAIPAFLTIVLMPFTYSISVGIGAGFVAYVLIKVVVGKAARGPPADVGRGRAVRRLLRDRPDHRPGSPRPDPSLTAHADPPESRAGQRVCQRSLGGIVSKGNELC